MKKKQCECIVWPFLFASHPQNCVLDAPQTKKAASRGFFFLVAEAGLEPTTFGL